MVAITVMRVVESPLRNSVLILWLMSLLLYLAFKSISGIFKIIKEQTRLKNLREFTRLGERIAVWLREHKEDLERDPVRTLNDPEFVELIRKDQELYERTIRDYPDYPDTVRPPKEFHQYMIELANKKHE